MLTIYLSENKFFFLEYCVLEGNLYVHGFTLAFSVQNMCLSYQFKIVQEYVYDARGNNLCE